MMMLSKGLVLTQLPMKMMMLSNIYIYILVIIVYRLPQV